MSDGALKVLLLSHGGITPESVTKRPQREDFPTLTMLWQNHGSASSFNREVVKLTMENVWGRFLYQTELMAALVTGGGQVILVNIEHQEPIAINLRRVVGEPMLSPAQGEVLLLSFTGHSTAEIATTLEIAPSTVADHIKNIYARLDVHSMRELSAQINQQMLRREH